MANRISEYDSASLNVERQQHNEATQQPGPEADPRTTPSSLQVDVSFGRGDNAPVTLRARGEDGRTTYFTFPNQSVFKRFVNDEIDINGLGKLSTVRGLAGNEALLEMVQKSTDVKTATFASIRDGNIFTDEAQAVREAAGLQKPTIDVRTRGASKARGQIRDIQQGLIDAGALPAEYRPGISNLDGKFGDRTRGGVGRYFAQRPTEYFAFYDAMSKADRAGLPAPAQMRQAGTVEARQALFGVDATFPQALLARFVTLPPTAGNEETTKRYVLTPKFQALGIDLTGETTMTAEQVKGMLLAVGPDNLQDFIENVILRDESAVSFAMTTSDIETILVSAGGLGISKDVVQPLIDLPPTAEERTQLDRAFTEAATPTPASGEDTAALRGTLAALEAKYPTLISHDGEGIITVKRPGIRDPNPTFRIEDGSFTAVNDPGSFDPMTSAKLTEFLDRVEAQTRARGMLDGVRGLTKTFPDVVSMRRPESGGRAIIVVKQQGIRGPYPTFRIQEGVVVPVEYPGSYDPMTLPQFSAYVRQVTDSQPGS
ncbi:MAG: hypothetical protein V3T05_07125 [Myxococcota bacterium]